MLDPTTKSNEQQASSLKHINSSSKKLSFCNTLQSPALDQKTLGIKRRKLVASAIDLAKQQHANNVDTKPEFEQPCDMTQVTSTLKQKNSQDLSLADVSSTNNSNAVSELSQTDIRSSSGIWKDALFSGGTLELKKTSVS